MGIIRVTFTGQRWAVINSQNVVAFDNVDDALNDASIAADLSGGWCTMLAAGQSNTFGWRNISIEHVGSGLAPANFPIVVNGLDGTSNTDGTEVVNQKFRIHTATAGRSGRGRIYLPGYRQTLWSSGQLNATGITNMTIRLNAIKGAYVGTGRTSTLWLGVLKRTGAAGDFKPAVNLTLSLTPGIQRRRNYGVGI